MFQALTLLFSAVSLILSLVVNPAWAWIPIVFVDLFVGIQLWAIKLKYQFNHIPDLSADANILLQKYGHYFAMPFASKDLSASAATSQFAGIAITIIGIFKSFWWGIAFGATNWFIMGFIAVSLSPLAALAKKPESQMAHDEIFDFLNSQHQSKTSKPDLIKNNHSKKTILVVDDDDLIVELLINYLKNFFDDLENIDTATNGAEALKKIHKKNFSAIITGVNMPGMDGITFYKHASEKYPDIKEKILFVTGTPLEKHWSFFEKNHLKHLKKPFTADQLKKMLAEILN